MTTEVKTDWKHPFSQTDVAGWKTKHGSNNVYAVKLGKDSYVIRGLGRSEFQEIAAGAYRSEDEMEESIVLNALLYPNMTLMDLRTKPAGVVASLLDYVSKASNIDTARDNNMEPVEMPKNIAECPTIFKDKITKAIESKEISAEDIGGWFTKYGTLYMNIVEDKLFVFRSVSRKEHEKFKTGVKEGATPVFTAEEDLVQLAILYPIPGKFTAKSDAYLHGTISIVSQLVYKASGFSSAVDVVQL